MSLAVKQRLWLQNHEDSAPNGDNVQQCLNTTYLTVTRMCPLFDHLIICISDNMYLKKLMTYNVCDFYKNRNHIYGDLVCNFISLCTYINTYIYTFLNMLKVKLHQ